MATLHKYEDFQSLKAEKQDEKKAVQQNAAERNEAWLNFLKTLQAAKKQDIANHKRNGGKL